MEPRIEGSALKGRRRSAQGETLGQPGTRNVSYASLAQISSAFPPEQWNPSTSTVLPGATVTGWLSDESSSLDGEIGTAVQTPINATTSPLLTATACRIVTFRTMARVVDFLYSADETRLKQAETWRKAAERLVDGIQRGNVADGEILRAGHDQPGAPAGNFKDLNGHGGPHFTDDMRF